MKRFEYIMPHRRRPFPEGHFSRAAYLASLCPGMHIYDEYEPVLGPWAALVLDTYEAGMSVPAQAEADWWAPRGVPLVSVSRTLDGDPAQERDDWALQVKVGPYEDSPGLDVGPLVAVSDAPAAGSDLLLVVSRWREGRFWLRDAARVLGDAALAVTHTPMPCPYVEGYAPDWIAGSEVVIGGAGGGNLYETLWAGKRLVAKAFCSEQKKRLDAAVAAGEAIVEVEAVEEIPDAVERVRAMIPIGRRQTGGGEFARLMGSL